MSHTWRNGLHLENVAKIGKMAHILENMGHTWKPVHETISDTAEIEGGYDMPARGYEFYLRVFNSISHE